MKKREILDICYKFFNEYIDAKELIELLSNVDKIGFSKKEINNMNSLIDGIKNIVATNLDKDDYKMCYQVIDYINQNDYFNEIFTSLTDYELLDFLTQYICAPFPPKLSQEEFDIIVSAGIKEDKREELWRMAFNFERYELNMDLIVDYFIKVKDIYYLKELVSVVSYLDMKDIIKKIVDKELVEELKK